MFKRVLAFVLMVLILLPVALAEDIKIEEPKNVKVDTSSVESIRDNVTDGMRNSGLGYSTDDIVTINEDSSLTVVADGVSITLLPPFGSVAISQDILAQFDVYSMFDDPLSVQQLLASDNTHIYVMDLSFETTIDVKTSEDAFSSIVYDIDQLDADVLNVLAAAVQKSNPSSSISLRTCGDNSFIVYDLRKSGTELLIYTSVKNNTNIDFYLIPGGNAITDDEISNLEYMLADVQLMSA